MTDHIPTDDDIEDTIERIETDSWIVDDFELEAGMYETPTVTFAVKFSPPVDYDELHANTTVREIVNDIEKSNDNGAHIDDIISTATKQLEIEIENVEHELEKLKNQGEVYEPTTDYLRTT